MCVHPITIFFRPYSEIRTDPARYMSIRSVLNWFFFGKGFHELGQ